MNNTEIVNLRDQIAIDVLQKVLQNVMKNDGALPSASIVNEAASISYLTADAMMKARVNVDEIKETIDAVKAPPATAKPASKSKTRKRKAAPKQGPVEIVAQTGVEAASEDLVPATETSQETVLPFDVLRAEIESITTDQPDKQAALKQAVSCFQELGYTTLGDIPPERRLEILNKIKGVFNA